MRRRIFALLAFAPIATLATDLLDARAAFRLVGAVRSDADLVLTWDVAPGYAVYRDRIRVSAATPVLTGAAFLPRGTVAPDGLGGSAEEYLEPFNMRIPLTQLATGHVSVRLQGCHVREPLVCFPPITVDVPVDVAPLGYSPRG